MTGYFRHELLANLHVIVCPLASETQGGEFDVR